MNMVRIIAETETRKKERRVEKMNESSTSKPSPGVKFKQNLENKDLKHTEGSDHEYERTYKKKKFFSFAGITHREKLLGNRAVNVTI